jgi:predicted GH43/DUF377 family glycosyl hydrolase
MLLTLEKPFLPRTTRTILSGLITFIFACCNPSSPDKEEHTQQETDMFPDELTHFVPFEKNPVFTGTGTDTWDQRIRERGYILKEEDGYHMWYTGFRENMDEETMTLGYASSPDGINWTRYDGNPVFTESWVEDMIVVKRDSLYYMFAEGKNDIAHLLTSTDKINWKDQGSLRIEQTNGEPISPGPYGTPTVYVDGDLWHLFYERNDEGIWHATSADLKQWKNVQDEPVIEKGPEAYDRYGVAVNQIIRHGDYYYAYYHGTPTEDWSDWNMNVAASKDLTHWQKYSGNPIIGENKSSGILVHDGTRYRFYTMHDQVHLHYPASKDNR